MLHLKLKCLQFRVREKKKPMEMDMIFFIATLLAVSKLFLCKERKGVCQISRAEVTCCPDYYNVNGTCTLCPKGSYGDRCETPCPFGLYGAGCSGTCDCNIQQTCNAEEGCVVNVTTHNSTTDVSTLLINTSKEQTTGQDLLATTESNLEDKTFMWQHITIASLVSLMLIVVLCSISFLVKHRNEKKRTRNIAEAVDVSAPEVGLDVIPQIANADRAAYGSDYAEIRDVEAAYADSRELSNDYNELAFYRSEARIHNFKSTNAVYDTAKNCSMQGQQTAIESREDSIDDIR